MSAVYHEGIGWLNEYGSYIATYEESYTNYFIRDEMIRDLKYWPPGSPQAVRITERLNRLHNLLTQQQYGAPRTDAPNGL